MKMNAESKKILERKVADLNHEIAVLEDREVKLKHRLDKEQKKYDALTSKLESLKFKRDKVKEDVI